MQTLRLLACVILLIVATGCGRQAPAPATSAPATPAAGSSASDAILAEAFAQKRQKLPVDGQGTVSRILADDLQGSRHQRFILRLGTGQTLLIAHNIDLAPRIANLQVGDTVHFRGDYEWNDKGGVVHWTHHDPAGRHRGGWLKHADQSYQ